MNSNPRWSEYGPDVLHMLESLRRIESEKVRYFLAMLVDAVADEVSAARDALAAISTLLEGPSDSTMP